MRKSWPLVVLLATSAAIPIACSKKQPVVPTMTVDAGMAMGDGGLPEGSDAGMMAIADAGADAAPMASGSAAPSSSAALGPALDLAIDTAIQAAALKNAPGMALEGTVNHQTVAEGGSFNQLVTLQPGRCYTVIAMSAPLQVTTLELKMLAPPIFTVEAGRSAATDKNPAVLGKGKGTCPILPIAVPYRVDTTARKGGGRVGVAVFSKAK